MQATVDSVTHAPKGGSAEFLGAVQPFLTLTVIANNFPSSFIHQHLHNSPTNRQDDRRLLLLSMRLRSHLQL